MRRENAKKNARLESAGQALHRMKRDKIPVDQRPAPWQLKNYRTSRQDTNERLAADCVASLQQFLSDPPAHVVLHEECQVVSAESVRIMFSFDQAEEWLSTQNLPCFSMDFTWKTNVAGLVLGAIGPIGLKAGSDGKPHLRFCPIVFLLARSEDEESQGLLVKNRGDVKGCQRHLDAWFLDNACYTGARKALEQDETMGHVKLHRCLQHGKENLRAEGRRKDPVSVVSGWWKIQTEFS